jgi:hypothetical protein
MTLDEFKDSLSEGAGLNLSGIAESNMDNMFAAMD